MPEIGVLRPLFNVLVHAWQSTKGYASSGSHHGEAVFLISRMMTCTRK